MTPAPKPELLTMRDVLRDCRAAAREAWEDVRDGVREKGLRRMLREAWRQRGRRAVDSGSDTVTGGSQ